MPDFKIQDIGTSPDFSDVPSSFARAFVCDLFKLYFTEAFWTIKGMSINKIRSLLRKGFPFKGFSRF